jgi:hypothetical protein
MKMYGEVDVLIYVFMTSALVGAEWSVSCPGRFTPREGAPGTYWIGGCMDTRTSLDDAERRKVLLLGIEI